MIRPRPQCPTRLSHSGRCTYLVLAAALAAWIGPGLFFPASAASVTVCSSGCDYTSIQAAVDNASPNSTIELGAETFVENVVVAKKLTIGGAGV